MITDIWAPRKEIWGTTVGDWGDQLLKKVSQKKMGRVQEASTATERRSSQKQTIDFGFGYTWDYSIVSKGKGVKTNL